MCVGMGELVCVVMYKSKVLSGSFFLVYIAFLNWWLYFYPSITLSQSNFIKTNEKFIMPEIHMLCKCDAMRNWWISKAATDLQIF